VIICIRERHETQDLYIKPAISTQASDQRANLLPTLTISQSIKSEDIERNLPSCRRPRESIADLALTNSWYSCYTHPQSSSSVRFQVTKGHAAVGYEHERDRLTSTDTRTARVQAQRSAPARHSIGGRKGPQRVAAASDQRLIVVCCADLSCLLAGLKIDAGHYRCLDLVGISIPVANTLRQAHRDRLGRLGDGEALFALFGYLFSWR
jgi:hypothetical protein